MNDNDAENSTSTRARPRREWPAEERRAITENARRTRRYNTAAERIRRIVDGMPPLTDEQRTKLALLLCPGGTGRRDAGDAA